MAQSITAIGALGRCGNTIERNLETESVSFMMKANLPSYAGAFLRALSKGLYNFPNVIHRNLTFGFLLLAEKNILTK